MTYNNTFTTTDLAFGFSMMDKLDKGNLCISPTSLRLAISMLYEGARGETAQEIAQVAMLPTQEEGRVRDVRSLMKLMQGRDNSYTLRTANGLWIDRKETLNEDYQRVLTREYKAECSGANFTENAEGERTRINTWVSDVTEGKIPELFGQIDPATVLALANALYFKGEWSSRFNEKHTSSEGFTTSDGSRVDVAMMKKGTIDGGVPKFRYSEFENGHVAELGYKGQTLSKMVMLPFDGRSCDGFARELQQYSTGEIRDQLHKRKFARLEMPRHELGSDVDLIDVLCDMGICDLFNPQKADLSGIARGQLYVGSGVHKTYFKTDEKGSEGAAATGFAVTRGYDPNAPVDFVCDRTYLEAVVHKETGAVVFLNRVDRPE